MGSIEPRTPSGPRVGTDSPTRSLIGDVVFNCGDDSRMQTRLADGQDGLPDRDTSQQLHAAIIDGTGTRGYRREAQELRLKGRSSGISFGGGHSLPMQHPAKAAGEGTEAAFVDAEGRPIPDRHSTAFAGANTATTFEFRGPDNSPPPARAREGIKCPEPGMRQRHTVDLSDRGPVDVHGAPLVPDFLGAKKSTAHSGPPSTFSVATAPFRRVPPGQYMREDGSLRHASPSTMRGGVSSVQGDLAWDPERNAAENHSWSHTPPSSTPCLRTAPHLPPDHRMARAAPTRRASAPLPSLRPPRARPGPSPR